MQIVARYETNGCWAGATGSFDGQWLSVGVMQWNLGTGSLQPMLARYKAKFSPGLLFDQERERLMPKHGRSLFDPSCRAKPIGTKCRSFLQSQYVGERRDLSEGLKTEIDRLFESDTMRQIQLDYFARNLTKVLDDLDRVFQADRPAAWQVAWAMDLKTQQGRFPTDTSIRKTRELLRAQPDSRKEFLTGIVLWYDGLCRTGLVDGVKRDCRYNVDTWGHQIRSGVPPDREEAVHFTHLVSRTASNQDGAYQADAFQRRATIAFGKGSVHGTRIDFLLK